MSELQFITTSINPRLALQDTESRRLIRTTATRATRSKRAPELSNRHRTHSDIVQAASLRGHITRFRLKQTDDSLVKRYGTIEPAPNMSLVDTQLSVWDPVVAPLGDQAWLLLHYYRYSFRSRSWALDAKCDWFAFIIEDRAATHATLAFVSLNRDLEEGSSISTATLYHRARAIRLVRQRIAAATASVEDSLIGAVALLSITEGLDGHSSASRLHVQALQKLVDLRGGFKKLHGNKALSRLVAWADLCHSSTLHGHPHLPGLSHCSDVNLNAEDVAITHLEEASTFQKAIEDTMSPEICDLVRLLATIPRCPPTDQTSIEERQNTRRLICNMNQLVLSIYRDEPDFRPDLAGRLAKVLCDATYLYISLVLRQMPRRTTAVIERAQKLHNSIIDAEYPESWDYPFLQETYTLMIFWAQTIHFCSLVSRDRSEVGLVPVRTAVKTLQIKHIDQMEDHLGRISWIKGCAVEDLELLLELVG